ncbi:MAG: S41 family peptidase [Phycisphaerae bacterium]
MTRRWMYWAVGISALVCTSVLWADVDEPQLASADARELWRLGSDQVLAGDFASAARTLERVRKIEPGHNSVDDALSWMREAHDLTSSRNRYRSKLYEYYTRKALEAAKKARENPPQKGEDKEDSGHDSEDDEVQSSKNDSKDESGVSSDDGESEPADGELSDDPAEEEMSPWWLALFHARNAMEYAEDEDTFRSEPWLAEIVKHTEIEIDRHKSANEWRDAFTLYEVLKKIFPEKEAYEKGALFCRKRAHLDFRYGDKKSTWRIDLADVTPEAISEILARIDRDYVLPPDFREICRTGLEHLLILARSESLSETFPTLGERDLVGRFVKRLNGYMRRYVERDGRFSSSRVRSVFAKVLAANQDTVRLPEEILVDEFVAGMLEQLDDFTSPIWPAEVPEFTKQTRGEFVGVGIQITQESGKSVRVESPLPDSPAYRAGIKAGDLITEVEGNSTADMTITAAVRAITGEPGTTVVLTIKDPLTNKSWEVPLKRERIKIHTVRGFKRDSSKPTGWDFFADPDQKIAHVRVSGFMDKTVKDLKAALKQLKSEGCRGLILDLRFNPGGLLTSAVKMCELFLDEDAHIVRTKGRSRQQYMDITAKHRGEYDDLPMIILVNEYSASASEIVAGALAGSKHACIVGARTFGKGSVQNLIPTLEGQAYLKLTTAHYYVWDDDLPGDERWYLLHKKPHAKTWGIEPHITVNVSPKETTKILRLLRERDVLKGKGQAEVPKEILERRPTGDKPEDDFPKDEDPNVDPQFAAALNIMRMKLISHQPWALAPRLERTLTAASDQTPVDASTKR